MAALIELEQTSAVGFGTVSTVILKRSQRVTVGETDVGMGVHVSVEVAERGDQRRMHGIAQVEEHGASTLEGIGKKEPIAGHLEFGVVRRAGGPGDGSRGDDLSVMSRSGIGIKDREEVVALLGVVSRPDE